MASPGKSNPPGADNTAPTGDPTPVGPGDSSKKSTFLEQTQALKSADLAVSVPESGLKLKGHQRLSTDYLEKRIEPRTATPDNFTTIVPEGLPPDVIGDKEERVERHNVLNEPKGMRNEAGRLPPFKPFKTISDEDNIHLLPGETGEHVRLYLLDTKQVTKKDIEDVRNAYNRLKSLHPELYDDNAKLGDAEQEPPPQKSLIDQLREEEAKKQAQQPKEKSVTSSYSYSGSGSGSSSSSESSDEDDDEAMAEWQRQMQQYYAQMGAGGYGGMPGFPGGYGMPGGPYPGGFGPCQMPCYNPCRQEIQYIRGKEGEEDGKEIKRRKKLKKPQGLDFDFLPHEDLATEVTFTIEPEDPDPLAYSIDNGVMPIICCYMPTSLAVSQMPQTTSSYAGHQPNPNPSRGPSYGSYGPYSSYGSYSASQTTKQSDQSSGSLPVSVGEGQQQLSGQPRPTLINNQFGQGTAPAPSTI